jgi:glycogen synthase
MKVLMFGWEFPPHISGGLGTACHGLTHSLEREDVEVLFVVPKLHGDEPAGHLSLINASDVSIKSNPKIHDFVARKYQVSSSADQISNGEPIQSAATTEKIIKVRKEKGLTQIEVQSTLSPYHSPDFSLSSTGIERWNHVIEEKRPEHKDRISSTDKKTKNQSDSTVETLESNSVSEPFELKYTFSGAYGPDLLSEVDVYAAVAAEIAKEFSFDVIHAHDWMTYPAGIAAKKVSGKPLVVHVHATEFDRAGENGDKRVYAIEHAGLKESDCVVTVSEWTKNIAIAKYGVPDEKIEVVHNGIIPKETNGVIYSSPLKNSPIVTFLGRVTHQKGPLFFVEAARKVLEQIPDARFVVAGSGDLLPAMIRRVAQLKMSSRFHFTGFLKGKDIDKVWSISNVYVMPSVSEPFGIAPLEAIQAGVPVIISRQSGVAEVMPHAMAVDFWNSTALADAICSVLKYKSLHQTLKKNSGAEIKNITWDKAAKKINHLYHELTTH